MSAFVLQNICAVNERKQGHLVLFHGAVNCKIHEHFSKTKCIIKCRDHTCHLYSICKIL